MFRQAEWMKLRHLVSREVGWWLSHILIPKRCKSMLESFGIIIWNHYLESSFGIIIIVIIIGVVVVVVITIIIIIIIIITIPFIGMECIRMIETTTDIANDMLIQQWSKMTGLPGDPVQWNQPVQPCASWRFLDVYWYLSIHHCHHSSFGENQWLILAHPLLRASIVKCFPSWQLLLRYSIVIVLSPVPNTPNPNPG